MFIVVSGETFVVTGDGLSCPYTFSPLLSLETSCIHVAEPLHRICVACCPWWRILFVFAQPSQRMSVACAFSGVSKSLLRRENKWSSEVNYKTRSMRKESTGGVDAHGLSRSYPVISKAMETAGYADPRC